METKNELQADEMTGFAPVISTLNVKAAELRFPGVLGARPGFSKTIQVGEAPLPVIILTLEPGTPTGNLPAQVNGIPVETETASPAVLLGKEPLLSVRAWEEAAPVIESRPNINYQPPEPSEVKLAPTTINKITCHVGPDSGWTTLQPFLEGTTSSLTVAMYEFYAQHVIDTVTALGEQGDASLKMILQVDKNDLTMEQTLTESWGDRLEFVKASVKGPQRIFNNSYHTKVAVRDSKSFWLSSGNWSPNSQPSIDTPDSQFLYKEGNREWHIIVDDEPLAKMYEKFIQYDMRKANEAVTPEDGEILPDLFVPLLLETEAAVLQPEPFAAETIEEEMEVSPLMSPDNYAGEILALIESAEESLYLQFSYIRQPSTEVFDQIIDAIALKMKEGLDVRVIVGPSQDAAHSDLLISKRKWKRKMFRKQSSKVHNKGILVDGKIAVVGSNNWSSDGTQYNRDTSLVIHSATVAAYYTKVFEFDWNNLAKPIAAAPEITPLIAPEGAPAPEGMMRVTWNEWYD